MAYIQKRAGKYRARYTDPVGKVRSRTFARRADADLFLRQLDADRLRGQWVDPADGDTAFATWAQEFLRLSRRLARSTQDTYARDLEQYIVPRFGAYRLGRMPAEEIENWLNDEIASGIAASSVHRHYRTLRRALQVAVEKQKIISNPCERVDPPRVPHREMVFLDWDEAYHLADAHSERYRAMILLAVDSGMRWSELIGLRVGKLDLGNRKVRVTEQLVQHQDRSFERTPPKTAAGVRSITFSSFTADALRDHLLAFDRCAKDDLVFVNSAGNPIMASSFRTHHLRPAQDRAGVRCRFHDLRHTSVALAIAAGAHPKAIQVRMGHASINVTLDRYGHLFPELDEAIADSFTRSLADAAARRRLSVVSADTDGASSAA